MTALLLALLLQGPPPEIHAEVDRDRLTVGEELVYTVRAVSRSHEPMQVRVAPFTGLEVVARSERSEVALAGGPMRTTVLEIRLRALRPGRWDVGPARAVQGSETAVAPAITIAVDDSPAAVAAAVNPRVQRLLQRAPPPREPGRAAVTVVTSAETVRVGEQVDVLTAAWFPRELRVQLRRPPTLQPPVIDRVWSYPQPSPPGIAATRTVGAVVYDLFIAHQVVFPLVAGELEIPAATLKYSVPLALQFFSQEERYSVTSNRSILSVRALPEAGRPAGFGGAVGSGLEVARSWTPHATSVGEGVTVEVVIEGAGNIALWPAPSIEWPAGVRAYPDRVEERVEASEGRLGGTKVFRYLVVPDSAGAARLPAIDYPYYDLATGRYATARAEAATLAIAPGADGVSRPLPPPLLDADRPAIARRIVAAVPPWGWGLVVAAPPLILMFRRRPGRRPSRRPQPPVHTGPSADAARELEAVLAVLVPDPSRRLADNLAQALRAAGVEPKLAARVVTVRERLDAERYGPPGSAGDQAATAADARALVEELAGRTPKARLTAVPVVLLALGLAGGLAAQTPAAEDLYARGTLRGAAEGFARRAAEEPAVGAHWYNLGAAHYRLGAEGRAVAAWVRARRLEPREGAIRRALRLAPVPDATSARWTWSAPFTPDELYLAAALLWIVGWAGIAARPGARRWSAVVAVAVVLAAAGTAVATWYRRPVGVVLEAQPLRLSPHGRAPAVEPLSAGGAVLVLRADRGWVLVRSPEHREGWLPADAVAMI